MKGVIQGSPKTNPYLVRSSRPPSSTQSELVPPVVRNSFVYDDHEDGISINSPIHHSYQNQSNNLNNFSDCVYRQFEERNLNPFMSRDYKNNTYSLTKSECCRSSPACSSVFYANHAATNQNYFNQDEDELRFDRASIDSNLSSVRF
jgi:hypothetical protein